MLANPKFVIPPQIAPAPDVPLVYFITAQRQRFPIKIGRSSSRFLLRRISQIQTALPYWVDVLFVTEGDAAFERELHDAYGRHRLRGEWFERHQEIEADLRDMRKMFPGWREWIA